MDDLCLRPALDLARRVRAREISAVELLQAHLDRVQRLNPQLVVEEEIVPDPAMAPGKMQRLMLWRISEGAGPGAEPAPAAAASTAVRPPARRPRAGSPSPPPAARSSASTCSGWASATSMTRGPWRSAMRSWSRPATTASTSSSTRWPASLSPRGCRRWRRLADSSRLAVATFRPTRRFRSAFWKKESAFSSSTCRKPRRDSKRS